MAFWRPSHTLTTKCPNYARSISFSTLSSSALGMSPFANCSVEGSGWEQGDCQLDGRYAGQSLANRLTYDSPRNTEIPFCSFACLAAFLSAGVSQ